MADFWAQIAVEAVARQALLESAERMMVDIGQAAQLVTPLKEGYLRGTSRVVTDNDGVSLIVGGSSAPYAALHEKGINPVTGIPFKYHYPGTGPHYVGNTFKTWIASGAWVGRLQEDVRRKLRSMP